MKVLEMMHFHMNGVNMFKPDTDLKTGFAMNWSNKSDFLTALLLKVAGKVSQPQELPPSTITFCTS